MLTSQLQQVILVTLLLFSQGMLDYRIYACNAGLGVWKHSSNIQLMWRYTTLWLDLFFNVKLLTVKRPPCLIFLSRWCRTSNYRGVILENQTGVQPVMTFHNFHANSNGRILHQMNSVHIIKPYFLSIILIPSFLIFVGYLMALSKSRLYSVKW
jgi:hypothetical protein